MATQKTGERENSNLERFIRVLESAKNLGDNIFDVFPVIFVLTDDNGEILKANRIAQRFFRLTEDQILGRKLDDIVPTEAAPAFAALFGRSDKKSAEQEFETRHRDAQSGDERYTFWNISSASDKYEFGVAVNVIVATDVTQLRKSHERIAAVEKDLLISRTIQNYLLPRQDEFDGENFRLCGHYRAAENVSGDWWWYEEGLNNRLNLILGDVTGHGIGAAMVTAKIASAYYVISHKAPADTSMQDLLTELNSTIWSLNDPLYCMSMFSMSCYPTTNHAELCFCGCNPVLLLHQAAGGQRLLRGGRFLGWEREPLIGFQQIDFLPGDRLFACTDGAFEFTARDGRPFRIKRLFQLVERLAAESPAKACEALIQEIHRERNGRYEDDMSFVILDRK